MISLCIVWPTGFDYPLFRKYLPELRKYVDTVDVFLSPHNKSFDLSSWLQKNVDAHFHKSFDGGGDWRNIATNCLVSHLRDSEWLLFYEPDFFIRDFQHFFKTIYTAMATNDVVGFIEGERFHPAFLLVRRDKLTKTSCDFSATNGFDHFGRVSEELKKYRYTTLPELGLFPDEAWKHMRGVTDNYFAPKPYFDLGEFKKYNQECMKVKPMSEYWLGEMERCNEI